MTSAPLQLPSSDGAKASNLAFALGSLPDQRKRDALVFYGFCRLMDDIADETDRNDDEKRTEFARWKNALEENDGLPPELADVIRRNAIAPKLLIEIIRGVEADIEFRQPATFAELQAYCWQVASAVGLVSIQIFGCREAASRDYAEQLGYALQITNILRDVGEDARLGRIYLPMEDLAKFQVSPASLLEGKPDGYFQELMIFEAERARKFFAAANSHFTATDAHALLPAEIMREIYEALLAKMSGDRFRVFGQRYRISKLRKMLIFTRRQFFTGRPAAASE